MGLQLRQGLDDEGLLDWPQVFPLFFDRVHGSPDLVPTQAEGICQLSFGLSLAFLKPCALVCKLNVDNVGGSGLVLMRHVFSLGL